MHSAHHLRRGVCSVLLFELACHRPERLRADRSALTIADQPDLASALGRAELLEDLTDCRVGCLWILQLLDQVGASLGKRHANSSERSQNGDARRKETCLAQGNISDRTLLVYIINRYIDLSSNAS